MSFPRWLPSACPSWSIVLWDCGKREANSLLWSTQGNSTLLSDPQLPSSKTREGEADVQSFDKGNEQVRERCLEAVVAICMSLSMGTDLLIKELQLLCRKASVSVVPSHMSMQVSVQWNSVQYWKATKRDEKNSKYIHHVGKGIKIWFYFTN